MTIKEKTLGPADPSLATSLLNLGVQRTLEGDPAAGKPLLERALAIREAAFGPDALLSPMSCTGSPGCTSRSMMTRAPKG